MAGQRCLVFKGLRLFGAKVCLFDSPPIDYTLSPARPGVPDVCRKKRFPKPHDCKILVPVSPPVTEISFNVVDTFFWTEFSSDLSHGAQTAEAALADMWARGGVLKETPFPDHFVLSFVWHVWGSVEWNWFAQGFFNDLFFIMLRDRLNPVWQMDDDVYFSVAFTPPSIPGVPDWCRLYFGSDTFLFNSVPVEIPVNKNLFYAGDVRYKFYCAPLDFSYLAYLSLPVRLTGPGRGWDYYDRFNFNFRLIVRRKSGEFKACWPEDVLSKSLFAAVVDSESGLVVGPTNKLN